MYENLWLNICTYNYDVFVSGYFDIYDTIKCILTIINDTDSPIHEMHEELLTYHDETRWKCTGGSVLIIFTEFDFLNDAFVFSLRDSCIDFTAHSKYVLMTVNKSCKNK